VGKKERTMVTFVINSKNAKNVVYKYYPENHTDSIHGVITIHLENGSITLDVVAEEDFLRKISADELNKMRNAINEMRIENGEPPLTEEALPTATESEEWYYYAAHAMRRMREEFVKGKILEKGTVAWY